MPKKRTHCWVLGIIFAEAFVVLVFRDFLVPLSDPVRHAFEIFLPGFKWALPATFLLGVIESFFWGLYLELMMLPLVKMYVRKHHHDQPASETKKSYHHAA
jgi:hypothetical protein